MDRPPCAAITLSVPRPPCYFPLPLAASRRMCRTSSRTSTCKASMRELAPYSLGVIWDPSSRARAPTSSNPIAEGHPYLLRFWRRPRAGRRRHVLDPRLVARPGRRLRRQPEQRAERDGLPVAARRAPGRLWRHERTAETLTRIGRGPRSLGRGLRGPVPCSGTTARGRRTTMGVYPSLHAPTAPPRDPAPARHRDPSRLLRSARAG